MKTAAINIIINENGETLFLLRKTKPFGWGLVGGKIEDSESAIDACIRETFEETGIQLTADQIRLVGNDKSINENPLIIFETILQYTPEVKINRAEHLNAKWIRVHKDQYADNYTDEVRNMYVFAGRTLAIVSKEKKVSIPNANQYL